MDLLTVLVFTLLTGVMGYSSIPPSTSCSSMTPEHSPSAQTTANPYQLVISKNTYSPCDQIQVTLQGLEASTQFRGFMIQARSAADSSTYTTYGSFATATGVGNPCERASATHANTGKVDKSSINLNWTAPNSDVGNIVFVYTVVQNYATYWVKQQSSTLTYLAGAGTLCNTAATTTASGYTEGTITRPTDCGKVISCFHDGCKGGNCEFMLTWKETGDDILFSLACKRPQNAYCAIGLSKDEKMGDDSVFECVSNGGQVDVYLSYNSGRTNSRLDQPKFGLSDVTTSSKDGVITCNFKRKKVAPSNTGRRKRAASDASTFFDLNSDFTLFYAIGSASSGILIKHSASPLVSSQVADFQSIQEIGGSRTGGNLVKAHGILMVIAWMLLASFGIFSARFYKDVWPEGFEWFSLKRWFVIHRACMVTVFLLTAISFIIIFVHVKGYSEITDSTYAKSHPILGIIVMALTLINPIMALFRPHPGTPKRPIFNVAHTLVGVGAHVCSIVNIFSGTALAAAKTPDNVRIVLWVYVGWLCMVDLVCYIYACKTKPASVKKAQTVPTAEADGSPAGGDTGKMPILGSSKKGESFELNNTAGDNDSSFQQAGVKSFKVWVLAVQGIGLFSLSLAVIIIVAIGESDEM
ncbi:putative ferric-chelate reductase 1 isoform X2 [Dreissena polymorpha]|uniref:Ferric-chelate reductase 1 n=2 Tax=Dreissena polymorpha TaxID=45954 RepID=A0A9D4RLG5_DREPO|nr:putative ferric-chelate reductase 1 isoform X2 [Dreissena polymorpha]XP_052265961.1 putative ferric-chelate reductase 1 isoform X2 [Dreissena polymorpha]KAH3870752.1 hypothetical protein DPMN_033942 [Dreissena polymorpha]